MFVSVGKNNEITGFMACLNNAETVVVDLIAVSTKTSGVGYRKLAVAFAIDHYQKNHSSKRWWLVLRS